MSPLDHLWRYAQAAPALWAAEALCKAGLGCTPQDGQRAGVAELCALANQCVEAPLAGACIQRSLRHSDVDRVAFAPSGGLLATMTTEQCDQFGQPVDSEQGVKLWAEVDTTAPLAAMDGHMYCGFSPNGALLATSTSDEMVLWRTSDGTVHGTYDRACCPAFSPDGALLVIHDSQGGRLVRMDEGAVHTTFDGHFGAFSPDGALLAIRESQGGGRLIRTDDGAVHTTFDGQFGAFSPDGAFAATARRTAVDVWRTADGACNATITFGRRDRDSYPRFCANGDLLVVSSGRVKRWTVDGRLRATIKIDACGERAMSSDGELLATRDRHGTVRLWHTRNAQSYLPLEGLSRNICPSRVAFSPDGGLLAIAADDDVLLCPTRGGSIQPALRLRRPCDFSDLAFSPGGELLAIHSESEVTLWSTVDGASLPLEPRNVRSVAFSPGDGLFATVGWDGTACLQWSLERLVRLAPSDFGPADLRLLAEHEQHEIGRVGARPWLEFIAALVRSRDGHEIEADLWDPANFLHPPRSSPLSPSEARRFRRRLAREREQELRRLRDEDNVVYTE